MSNGALKLITDGKATRAESSQARVADPCLMAIFGAVGDLATRKLLPALYTLRRAHLLPDEFAMVGLARDPLSQEDFRQKVRESPRIRRGDRFSLRLGYRARSLSRLRCSRSQPL
jgi:glucose-6-phosphate 1-dehydrogenase